MALDVITPIVIFCVALYFLVKASDWFTDSAEAIGLKFGIPAFIIGVTIVAFGTSLPELVSSIFAVLAHDSEIVVGNVVGSNIANITLVLAIAAIISKELNITRQIIRVDLPLLLASAALLTFSLMDGYFDWIEGLVFMCGFFIYIMYTIKSSAHSASKETKSEAKHIEIPYDKLTWPKLVASAFVIFVAAKYTIESVLDLSVVFGIGTEIIAVVAVALGTSLPELMVTISAAKRGAAEIAIGNVLGSNIINTFLVMAIPSFIAAFTPERALFIPASIINFGLPVMIAATLMYFVSSQDNQITKWEGWMFLLIYILFVIKTFV